MADIAHDARGMGSHKCGCPASQASLYYGRLQSLDWSSRLNFAGVNEIHGPHRGPWVGGWYLPLTWRVSEVLWLRCTP